VDVNIITVDRRTFCGGAASPPHDTLRETLASLAHSDFRSVPTLFVGSDSIGHVPGSHPREAVVALSPAEVETLAPWSVHRRATYNYWCALAYSGDDVLILEDDLHFAPNWLDIFTRTRSEIERTANVYALALYCPHGFTLDFPALYGPYPPERFFGTQAMYYPAGVRADLAGYLHEHGVVGDKASYDFLIRDFCIATDTPLFACRRSLVQHTAPFSSTGLGGGHDSVSFLADDRDPMAAVSMRHLRPARHPRWRLHSTDTNHYLAMMGKVDAVQVNASAVLVWELIDGIRTGAEIADRLAQLFPEQAASIPRDVEAALEMLLEHGAVQVAVGR
jgi:hypothetical protein